MGSFERDQTFEVVAAHVDLALDLVGQDQSQRS